MAVGMGRRTEYELVDERAAEALPGVRGFLVKEPVTEVDSLGVWARRSAVASYSIVVNFWHIFPLREMFHDLRGPILNRCAY